MKQKTALVFGATGLVGSHLVRLLLDDEEYGTVRIFSRRGSGIISPKLDEQIVDFDKPGEWRDKVRGDVIFSCMGTTIKKAGSKEAQFLVDYTYQFRAAAAAAENGVRSMVLVSAPGAHPESRIFYNRIKGELDRDIIKLPFERIRIIRPSVLDGERKEKRRGESMAIALGKVLAPLIYPLKKYRPVHAGIVAAAMIAAEGDGPAAFAEYELEDLFNLSEGKRRGT